MTLGESFLPDDYLPHQILRRSAHRYGNRLAVWCDGETQDYATLWDRSCRLANALTALGIEPGDRVALLSENHLAVPEQMAGLAIAGAVRAALYTHVDAATNLQTLRMVGAKVLIVQARHHDPALTESADLEHVIVFDGAVGGTLDYEALIAGASSDQPAPRVTPDSPHSLRFSSGTTGTPKGILHTVRGAMRHGFDLTPAIPELREDDVYLAAAPLPHATGVFLWPIVDAGAAMVVMPSFSPDRMLQLAEQHRATITFVVPSMIRMLVDHPDAGRRDLSSFRAVLYSSSPISEETLLRAHSVFGDVLYQFYGQSEGGPISILPPEDHSVDGTTQSRERLASAGRVAPAATVRIVDEDGEDVERGEVGEIAFTCGSLLHSLWNEPSGLEDRWLPDGHLRSGDMGRLDEDGFLYLVDRRDDMIVSGGLNLWPAEIERALSEHPAVAEACVVGVPDSRWGETPKAVVVLEPGANVTDEDLIAWSRERLGPKRKVTSVDFVDDLPRSGLGKVLRRAVRDPYWTGRSRKVEGA